MFDSRSSFLINLIHKKWDGTSSIAAKPAKFLKIARKFSDERRVSAFWRRKHFARSTAVSAFWSTIITYTYFSFAIGFCLKFENWAVNQFIITQIHYNIRYIGSSHKQEHQTIHSYYLKFQTIQNGTQLHQWASIYTIA